MRCERCKGRQQMKQFWARQGCSVVCSSEKSIWKPLPGKCLSHSHWKEVWHSSSSSGSRLCVIHLTSPLAEQAVHVGLCVPCTPRTWVSSFPLEGHPSTGFTDLCVLRKCQNAQKIFITKCQKIYLALGEMKAMPEQNRSAGDDGRGESRS